MYNLEGREPYQRLCYILVELLTIAALARLYEEALTVVGGWMWVWLGRRLEVFELVLDKLV